MKTLLPPWAPARPPCSPYLVARVRISACGPTLSLLVPMLVALLLLSPAPAAQAGRPLLDPRLTSLLHEELSGELAKESVIAITRHHRVQGSRGYRDAARWLLDQLAAAGFDESHAAIESFPSDGRVSYQTWQSPSGWDITSAELRMLSPRDERLVGYPEIAMSVMTYSNAGDATAPLVFVGAGTSDADYEGLDVTGKFVLATGYGGDVHRQAVLGRGAAGVICYLDDERAAEHPDMLAYTGIWPRGDELGRVTFGFNLTHRQGEQLRRLLANGEDVVLHGRVAGTGLESFGMDVVVATIEGSEKPEQEILLTAHLDHPKESANDNASGSAALLDIARGLTRLIAEGRMGPPRRTLRFLWVPEFFGSMAYVDSHPELAGPALGGSVLADLNLDMVGENTELLHCRMELTRNPASLPSVLGDVLADMAEQVAGLNVRTPRGSRSAFHVAVTPFAPGSDHMVLIDRRVPASMFWHNPDYTHHSSEDTPDKVDPVELERAEIIAAGAALYLANLSARQAVDLAWLTAAESSRRLGLAGRRAQDLIVQADPKDVPRAWAEADNLLDHASRWEMASLRSVLDFALDPAPVSRLLPTLAESLTRQWAGLREGLRWTAAACGATIAQAPALDPKPDTRVPLRLTRGPLAFDLLERGLPAERFAWYRSGAALDADQRFELVNFVDGTASVSQIRNALSAEFGPLDRAAVARVLEDLVSLDVIAWR